MVVAEIKSLLLTYVMHLLFMLLFIPIVGSCARLEREIQIQRQNVTAKCVHVIGTPKLSLTNCVQH